MIGRPKLPNGWRDVAAALGYISFMAVLWPKDDAFYSTLCVMPVVIVGLLRLVGSTVTVPRWIPAGFVVAMLTLPLRHRLGWPQVDVFWAGCLLILLGAYLWHLVPGLRRRLGSGARPGAIFFTLPFLVHLAWLPWAVEHRPPDGDEPYYLLLTHSLVHDQDVELSNNYKDDWSAFLDRPIEPQPGDPVGEDGEIYSRHNALLPLVLSPFYALGGRLGAALFMTTLASALAWWTLKVALVLWPKQRAGALCAWALIAFAPPLTVFSHQIWVEVPAALLLIVALDAGLGLHRAFEGSERQRNIAIRVVRLALCLMLLILLKMRFLLVAAPLAVFAYWPLRRRRGPAIALGAVLAAALGSILTYNYLQYGNPLKMYSVHEVQRYQSPLQDYVRGAVGLFYDCAFGLFAVAPIWLLLLPAVAWLAARRDRYLGTLLWLAGPYFLALAPRLEWYGGWSPPFRYPLVLLPLLALATVPLLDRRSPGVKVVGAVLGSITALVSVFWLVIPGWTYHLADGGNDLLHRLGWMLGGDVVRFFPSTIRPRAATWIWLVGSLSLLALHWLRSRPLRHLARRPTAIGAATLLIVAILLPVAAHTVPTRVIHWEDGFIAKRGGRLEPDLWTPVRPSKVGGWMLPSRGELIAPVVPGGDRVRIRLITRREMFGTPHIHVLAGTERLDILTVTEFADWQVLETDVVGWPAGAPLVLSCPKGPENQEVGIHVDRVELDWL